MCSGAIILCGYQSKEYKEWYEESGWIRHALRCRIKKIYLKTEKPKQ